MGFSETLEPDLTIDARRQEALVVVDADPQRGQSDPLARPATHLARDHLDGLTVRHAEWWFNVRASNTEPLLRLNVEAADEAQMAALRDDVLALMRTEA